MAGQDESFDRQMERFAKALREKAEKDTTPLEEATDAFKALTTYYAILRKYPRKDDEDGDVTFDQLQEDVRTVVAEESAQHGTAPAVPGGNGRVRPQRRHAQ